MICHKYPTMNCDTVFDGTLIQPIGISRDILVARKAGLPVVASLDDVNGKSCRAKSHVAWNNCRMSRL
jgi:hypothetical protein